MTRRRIELGGFRSVGVRVYCGQERGELVRKSAGLDSLDTADGPVEIHIPEDTFSVANSFFRGMFGDSIRRLGVEQFRKQYQFTGRDIQETVETVITWLTMR